MCDSVGASVLKTGMPSSDTMFVEQCHMIGQLLAKVFVCLFVCVCVHVCMCLTHVLYVHVCMCVVCARVCMLCVCVRVCQ